MKILIADDERYIRNGLENNVDWKFLKIDTVLTAEDGIMAKRICAAQRPEIIISDIRMPGLDGLELAKQAIENYGARKVILLSGYSEFEYAKKAISIGVAEYLLKPVNLEELTELLIKSLKEIKNADKQEEIIRQREIKRVLEEGTCDVLLRELLYKQGEKMPREVTMAVIEKNEIYGHKGQKNITEVEKELRILDCSQNIKILYKEEEIVFLIEANDQYERLKSRQVIWSVMKKVIPDYSVGVSRSGVVTELYELYRQSREALRHRLYCKNAACVFYEEIETQQERIFPLLNFNKDIFKECIELLNTEKLESLIHEQFVYLYENRCIDHRVPVELCTVIENIVFEVMQGKGVDIAGILDKNQTLFQDQLHFSNLSSYEEWIQDYCSLLLRGLKDLAGKKYSSMISKAVDYIQQHYMEEITLKSTAEEVNKSASYFSCIFKKEMGVNFNEYLNQIRIRNAKQLLRKSDSAVYQVADAVGFRDYKYFTKVFKKMCGCTPGEYSRRGEGKS